MARAWPRRGRGALVRGEIMGSVKSAVRCEAGVSSEPAVLGDRTSKPVKTNENTIKQTQILIKQKREKRRNKTNVEEKANVKQEIAPRRHTVGSEQV